MTTMKTCKDCNIGKGIECFEATTKDGKSRRAVCKPCYNRKKAERAKEGSKDIDPSTVPKPLHCVKCGKGGKEVTFKWRKDLKQGGWRTECNTCNNLKGYSEKSRAKRRDENEEEYLSNNAKTHLEWAHANPDKIEEQKMKTRTDPSRRFKALVTYIRSKYGNDEMLNYDDSDKLESKMSLPCHYCDHSPNIGEPLNGLDRITPGGKYEDSNTVPCCGVCNSMKLTFTVDEFIQGVRDIVGNRGHSSGLERPTAFGGTSERRATTKDKTDELTRVKKLELWSGECYLCSRGPSFGIDRVDPSKNYTEDNCKSCCSLCNYMKKDLKETMFLTHVSQIHIHTSRWVLGDIRNVLNIVAGQRKPVAPLDEHGTPLIIFPSAGCAKLLIGYKGNTVITDAIRNNAKCNGYNWMFVKVKTYKEQYMKSSDCMEILCQLNK